VEIVDLTRSAEALHADEDAVFADEAFPTERDCRFNGYFHRRVADGCRLVGVALLFEKLEAWNGNDAGRDALAFQKVAGLERGFHFRAGCEDRHPGVLACGSKLIGAVSRQV